MDIRVDGVALRHVKEFVYLGAKISSDGTSEEDIERRVGLARGVLGALGKLWGAKDIIVETNRTW